MVNDSRKPPEQSTRPDVLLGIDIGGTKFAATIARGAGQRISRIEFPTDLASDWGRFLRDSFGRIDRMIEDAHLTKGDIVAAGVSCGGPLNESAGLILSPPNLPGWDTVPVRTLVEEHFGVPCALMNDANACALAEWHQRGRSDRINLVFLTYGTGMGAGFILKGELYAGASFQAGEVGRLPLRVNTPRSGSLDGTFEQFCSGRGLVTLAHKLAVHAPNHYSDGPIAARVADQTVSAKELANRAREGDPLAQDLFRVSGTALGLGLAMIVDMLNPDLIVIGSIYARCKDLLADVAQATLAQSSHPLSVQDVKIEPSALGESLGDIAGLMVAETAVETALASKEKY
jgi:glucokinase